MARGSLTWIRRLSFAAILLVVAVAAGPAARVTVGGVQARAVDQWAAAVAALLRRPIGDRREHVAELGWAAARHMCGARAVTAAWGGAVVSSS